MKHTKIWFSLAILGFLIIVATFFLSLLIYMHTVQNSVDILNISESLQDLQIEEIEYAE